MRLCPRRSTSDFRFSTSAFLAACLVSLSCADAAGPEDVPGRYVLQSVAFRALPVTIVRDSALEIAVLGGSIMLQADSGFVDVRIYRVTAEGEAPATLTDTLMGTWSLSPNKVTFSPTAGVPYEMYHSGKNLTWYVEGFTHQYWK